MAALWTLRRASLRPVLFLLVFFFVLVPLVVYNIFDFNIQRVASLERRVRSGVPSVSVPACLAVDSPELLRADTWPKLHTLCGSPHPIKPAKVSSKVRLVHFVHVALDAVPSWAGEPELDDGQQFTYLQFAALQSARRVLRPDMMMLHYLETPRGVWYTQCQRHLGLHQVLPPVSFDAVQSTGPPLSRHERRRIIELLVMLRTLRKHGGVAFSDFNTFLLRPLGVDMDAELLVAGQSSSKRFSIGLHVMQAPPGHPLVELLEQKIIKMVEDNDPRLHQMPLDELVGQIVLEKYQEVHSEANVTDAATKKGSVLDGVVVGTSSLFELDGLHDLLTAKLGPSLAGKFRGVAGFHVDRYDFSGQTADTDDLRQIAQMQKELTLADEWQNLDSLLGAVVRLAVTANSTAELEPLFT